MFKNYSFNGKNVSPALNRPWVIGLILVILFFMFSIFKVMKIEASPYFSPSGPGNLFYSEAAYLYRYSQIFATEPAPFQYVSHDPLVEYPSITDSFRHETILEEMLVGYSYRILPLKSIPFHIYLIYFHCFFSSLILFLIFLITRAVTKNNWLSLLCVLFFISVHASYAKMVVGVYERQDFALVWLLSSIYLFIRTLKEDWDIPAGVLAGITAVLAVSSWHFSSFFFLCLTPCLGLILIYRPQLLKNMAIPFAFLLPASILVPVLNSFHFSDSLLMCFCYALFISYFLTKIIPRKTARFILLASLFAGIFILFKYIEVKSGGPVYNNVFSLLADKIRFFLIKPENPNLLSLDARVSWNGPFNSASPGNFIFFGRLTVLLGIIGACLPVVAFIKMKWSSRGAKNPSDAPEIYQKIIPALMVFTLFVLTVMTRRVLSLLVPFCAICTSYLFVRWIKPVWENKARKALVILGTIAAIAVNIYGINLLPEFDMIGDPIALKEVYSWMKNHTAPGEAFVSQLPYGSMILLNTQRPEVLHSKIESAGMIGRYEEYILAMYSKNEDALYQFCLKYQIRHLVYSRELFIFDSTESERYIGCAVPSISTSANASRLFFIDGNLRHFQIEYLNNYFSIFKVVENTSSGTRNQYSPAGQIAESVFRKEGPDYTHTWADFMDFLVLCRDKKIEAEKLLKDNNPKGIIPLMEPLIRLSPYDIRLLYYYTTALMNSGDPAGAIKALDNYLKFRCPEDFPDQPANRMVLRQKAAALSQMKSYSEAISVLTQLLPFTDESDIKRVYYELFRNYQYLGNTAGAEKYRRLSAE